VSTVKYAYFTVLTLLHFYTFTLLHFYTFTLLHFYTFTIRKLLDMFKYWILSKNGQHYSSNYKNTRIWYWYCTKIM